MLIKGIRDPPHWDLPTFVLSVGFIFVLHGKGSLYTSAVCPHFGAVRSEINIFLTSHILKSENQHKLNIIFYSESPHNPPPPPPSPSEDVSCLFQ